MKYMIATALVLLLACKKDEPSSVVIKAWCGSCGIDYFDGTAYVHDTLGTLRDTIGPVIDTVTLDTTGWNVNVTQKHQFEYTYEGRRIYLRSTGPSGEYAYLSATYLNDQHRSDYANDGDSVAVIDLSY